MTKGRLAVPSFDSRSHHRQVWVIWTGYSHALRLAYRPGAGILIARVIGDEVFPA